MASVKVQVLLLLLSAVLLLSISPTGSEVVDSVKKCPKFFLDGTPPNIPEVLENGNIKDQKRYKVICQTFFGQRTFVTVYDTKNKIPVFSAYNYTGSEGGRPNKRWKIEPQLEGKTDKKNMRNAGKSTYTYQAGDIDYKNNQSYTRGHLLPSSYGNTENDQKSMFTLTNVVPQIESFNQESWSNMEQCVKCVMDEFCRDINDKIEAFVVIGAEPSESSLLNNKVNIPSKMWTAFCCQNKKQNTWFAGAHWGENDDKKTKLQMMTLNELHDKMKKGFEVFPKTECPRDAFVFKK